MKNTSQILLSVFATSCLLSSAGTPVFAGDVTEPTFVEPAVVRFTPVPYRRIVRTTNAPVRVASRSSEVGASRQPEVSHAQHRVTGTFDLVKNAVLKRVENYKASQPVNVLVPAPRDLEPRSNSNSMIAATSVPAPLDLKPYTPRPVVQNRKSVRFFSATAVRSVY